MHPAGSVILFTTSSGAGYGLLMILAVLGVFSPDSLGERITFFGLIVSLVLVTIGLLSSTLHLGHPERAWRAISQWRSSWLSREGLLALLAYIPSTLLLLLLLIDSGSGTIRFALLLLTGVLSLLTVISTAMIYQVLKPVHAWHNSFVLPGYLLAALSSGSVLFMALSKMITGTSGLAHFIVAILVLAFVGLKGFYWFWLRSNKSKTTRQTALGVPENTSVKPLEAPHTEANYLMKEMGYKIARKHAGRLRRLFFAFAGLVVLLVLPQQWYDSFNDFVFAFLLLLPMALALLVERWLFFAEAKHAVSLYYDRDI